MINVRALRDALFQSRFPAELESAYQRDYFRRSLKPIRLGLKVVLVVVAMAVIIYLLYYAPERGFEVSVLVALVSPALLLGFTYHKRFERFWKPALTLCGAFMGLQLLQVYAPLSMTWRLPTSWSLVASFAFQQSIMTITFVSIMRLPFLWTAIWLWLIELGATAIMARVYHLGWMEFGWYYLHTFIVLVFLMFTAFMLERHHRADFLNLHLLNTERARSENLLLNILPGPIAERLKLDKRTIADCHQDVSVLFADIVGFTPFAARLSPAEVVQVLNEVFSAFDHLVEKHGLEKIKTVGDAYMVAGNLSKPCEGHLEAMAEVALGMLSLMDRFGRDSGQPLQVRIGIHTGPVIAGVIGTKKFIYDVWGDTVNVASRMESHAVPGGIQLTAEACKPLQELFNCSEARELDVKGRGVMTTYRLLGRKPETTPDLSA